MAVSRTVRGARIDALFQCRVTPATKFEKPKGFFSKREWTYDKVFPVNFDSALVFPTDKDAMGYFPVFIRSLFELGMLIPDQPYETSLVELSMFDKEM